MSKLKKNSIKDSADGVEGSVTALDSDERVNTFKEYDVSQLPLDAQPLKNGIYKGRHSYTVSIHQAVTQLL